MAKGDIQAPLAEPCPGLREAEVPTVVYPSPNAKDPDRRHSLVFFIPGNPGLVEYYLPFLETLRQRLDEAEARNPGEALHIYGENLIGFSDADHAPFGASSRPPFSLEEQICHFTDRVAALTVHGRPPHQVILMGHSVGTYISLEVFDRLSKRQAENPGVHVKAAVLLFPTISHLAESPSGPWLERVKTTRFLDAHAHGIAKRFVDLWPTSLLNMYIRYVMGFSPPAAAATVSFLHSRDGIWQALHLGKDEVQTISEDKWSEDMWEIADAQQAENGDLPKFFFHFGAHDHWVSNKRRDEFIRQREEHATRDGPRHKQGRTRIVIDADEVPHAYCIHHSEIIAEKVSAWVDEIITSA